MKTHFSFKHLLFLGGAVLYSLQSSAVKNPVDYVSTLVGTQSKFELSTGNTYPAISGYGIAVGNEFLDTADR